MAYGLQRVGGLAGLRDGDHQRAAVQDGVAVAEFTRDLDFDRQPGPVFDRVLGQHPRVVCGAAGDDEHLVDLAKLLVGQTLLVEHDAPVDEVPEQGVGDRSGLLGDLLEHEVLVAALLGGGQVPVDVEPTGGDVRIAEEVGHAVTVGGDHHGLVLTQLHGFASVLDEGRDVGPQEHLAVTDTDHQRRRTPCGHDGAGIVRAGEHQREMALQPRQHGHHGTDEVTRGGSVVVLPRHQVDGDLGVRVADELDASGLQLGTQHSEVLDDPVVDNGDLARRVPVRMGVAVGRPAVSRPAGVSHAGVAGQASRVGLGERRLQVGQPPSAPTDRHSAVAVEQRDARGVIAPVLHPTQRVDDDVAGRTVPDVADDSTHDLSG